MDKNHITEKILKLTLEIIYLLTGEDYSVVTKAGRHMGIIRGVPRPSGGSRRTVSPVTDPPPSSEVHVKNNHQKILDLTNKMIELLTGEVPIRCEDIIVCFSMEEWEYIEGHKDLYKDVLKEGHPFLGSGEFPSSENLSMKLNFHMLSPEATREDHSLRGPKTKNNVYEEVTLRIERDQSSDPSTCTRCTQTEPADGGEGAPGEDREDDLVFVPSEETLMGYSSEARNPKDTDVGLLTEQIQNTHAVECHEDGALEVDNVYTPTSIKSTDLLDRPTEWVTNVNFAECPIAPHHISTQYTSSSILQVCEEGNVSRTDVYTPTDHNKMEETPMSWGKDIIYTDIYTPVELTQADLTSIKKELVSWQDGSLELQNIYIPMEEKAAPTSGGGDAVQWNGSRPRRDSYPSPEETCPRIKTEYVQEDFADHYATPAQTQPTSVPVNNTDGIKKETERSYTTDEENESGTPAYAASHAQQMYSCPDCKKCFSTDTNLAKHRPMCKGRKPHVCSGCGKCFASASYLVIHERIHTGEKPFSCSHCGKSFTRKPDLIRHERIHTGEKPFACPECGKCFTSVSNIYMHRKIHTGEKRFPCAECGKRFIKKSDLVRHEKIHGPHKALPCSQCGKLFGSKTILSKHMAVHSAETPETERGGS